MIHILQKTPRRHQQTGCPSSHESTGSSRSHRRRRHEPARCRRRLPQPTDPVCAALAPLLPNLSLPPSVSPSLVLSLPPGGGGRHGAARAAPPRSVSTRCRIHGLEARAGDHRTGADDAGGGRGHGGEKAAPLPGRRGGRWCELRHTATSSSAAGRCRGCRAALLEEVCNSSLGSRPFAPCKLLSWLRVVDSPRGLQVAPVLCSIYDHVAAGAGGVALWS
jgi:hypothetical protein